MQIDHSMDTVARPSLWTAFRRGLTRRCPRCGEGRIFTGYLAAAPRCGACDEELARFRSDDAPAYFTIFIVGHIVVPAMLLVEQAYHPATSVHTLLWVPLTLGLTFGLLPFVKGALVGVQWSVGVRQDPL
jgi:uncharacterized protein (DUF983 family)